MDVTSATNMFGFVLILFTSIILGQKSPYEYRIKYFDVPLDHFSFANNKTFQIRYLYNDTYVRHPYGPILFYTGNEGRIESFAENTGFMWELAEKIHALIIFAEHRYYGKSLPFGNTSFDSPQHLGFLTSTQALADYADLLEKLNPLSCTKDYEQRRPVIAVGGSYGGMLAAWFRQKYPHLITGALAASAPVLQFANLSAPCDIFSRIVTTVFNTVQPQCMENIRKSWDIIKKTGSTTDGLKLLNSTFLFCGNVSSTIILDKFIDYLTDVYGNLAMVNYPYEASFLAPLPANPVKVFCSKFSDKLNETTIIPALKHAVSIYSNYTGQSTCLNLWDADGDLGSKGWDFQACTEMIMPQCSTGVKDMFPKMDWDLKKYSDSCYKKYGVRPHVKMPLITYGGMNLHDTSNIIFSNGLLDPWSGGGVIQTSNDKIKIIIIPEGAHHLDLRARNEYDPRSVNMARNMELDTILQWVENHWRR